MDYVTVTMPSDFADICKPLFSPHRDKCPGQKECDDAIDLLNSTINQLDQAVLAAMSQQLQPSASSTLQVVGGINWNTM